MTANPVAMSDAKIGPGRLVLVVGPSGAGKDSLIDLARAACCHDPGVVFPRRVVTRDASPAEDNDTLAPEAFERAAAAGAFAVHWEAHGHRYGVPKAIDDALRAGRSVVVNVSRGVIPALRAAYSNVVVVAVTAPPEVLAQRLAARARPSDGDLGERLHRPIDNVAVAPTLTIVNVGGIDRHAAELLDAIRG